jgi:prepilin-type N-terminal cleavage/methylation domain-containing protein
MKVRLSRKAGFTLVEIMIVVGIIGLLTPLAVPTFLRARANSQRTACINNLRQIDAAKHQWSLETGKTRRPDSTDLTPYLNRAGTMDGIRCPLDPGRTFDTSYSVEDLDVLPKCSIEPTTHALPAAP